MPSGTTFPSLSPTTLSTATTSGHFQKSLSTPRCDEYSARDKLYPPQMGPYQNTGPNQPVDLVDHNILHTIQEEILLQTRSC
jgi:hypothetical protein